MLTPWPFTVARKLGISRQVLEARLKKDPKLQEARDGGTWDGQNIVSDAMFRKMLDRYMTICSDCHKIRFSFDMFYETCPYCDKVHPIDPETGQDETGNDHTQVKHRFVPGDTGVMIFWAKNHMGMAEKVELAGKKDAPIKFQWLKENANDPGAGDKRKAGKV
jgi:hypothetical protein